MNRDPLPSWRETPAKQAITEFVAAVTNPDSADFVAAPERIAVFDNVRRRHRLHAGVRRRDLRPAAVPGNRQRGSDRVPGRPGRLYAAATEHKWTMIDIAADWSVIYPPFP